MDGKNLGKTISGVPAFFLQLANTPPGSAVGLGSIVPQGFDTDRAPAGPALTGLCALVHASASEIQSWAYTGGTIQRGLRINSQGSEPAHEPFAKLTGG